MACSLESGKVPDFCRMPDSEPGVGTDVYVKTPLQPTHSCIDPLGRKTLYPAQLAAASAADQGRRLSYGNTVKPPRDQQYTHT